jgi:hypothetical protein
MIIKWILSKILKRKYFIGVDRSNGTDFGAECQGYVDKHGKAHITKVIITK